MSQSQQGARRPWSGGFVGVLLFALVLELGISLHLFYLPPVERTPHHFVPSPDYVKCLSGTFRPLFAQMFFMKGVLETAQKTSEKLDFLLALFQASIQLDPRLTDAAFFGGVVVPKTNQEMSRGIALLREAASLSPSEWRFPYWIGIVFLQMEDYLNAAENFRHASELPDSPAFLKTNLALLYFQANRPETALKYFEGLGDSVKDRGTREAIQARIDWLKCIILLDGKVSEFQASHGRWPSHLDELVQKGLLKEIPPDPFGDGFYLDTSVASESKGCRVKSWF